MKHASTDSFILTLPLHYEAWQRDKLDKVFKVAGYMYNNLVDDRKRALTQMEQTKEWRAIQNSLRDIYQEIAGVKPTLAQEETLKILYTRRNALLSRYGMNQYAFEARIKKWRRHYKALVGAHVAQKIAMAVWSKFEDALFGSGKQVAYKPWQQFLSIEGKSNASGIHYRDGVLFVNKMCIPVALAANTYEEEALSRRVKYCRLVRIPWKDGWLYKLQLVLEGTPPVKADPETGELLHPLGTGRVGIDIGTQTVAMASSNKVFLKELADKANLPHQQVRRTNRAMDRSRRAMNQGFFKEDGTIVPRTSLQPEQLDTHSRRKWVDSKRYQRLSQQRRYLYAKLARIRKHQHQEMANRMLTCGDTFYVEEMNFRGLAKRAKKQEPKTGERPKRRKRFGKSVANKAPAMFLNILEKKVSSQGGTFYHINTWSAKASQYNHMEQVYRKKKLSQRWNHMLDGRKVQRDMYSAFLIMNTNATLDGFDQDLCNQTFEGFYQLHNLEVQRLLGVHTPSSTGIQYKP